MIKRRLPISILLGLLLGLASCDLLNKGENTQDKELSENARYIADNYVKTEHRIKMRDGVELFTAVYSPKDTSRKYPIMLLRTPYSVDPYGEDKYRDTKLGSSMVMTKEKFIFAYQDVRGKFMSQGQFVNMRPMSAKGQSDESIDESTDTYDTIDWLVNNVPNNNGKVGMWGISYPGFYAACALVNAHPALKAVSPQAPIADWFFDDFHHHGAFFLAHAFRFLYVFGKPRPELTQKWGDGFEFPTEDGYRFYLEEIGPLKNINAKYYKREVPFWNDFVAHPNYDEYWQTRNLLPHLKDVKPAVMTVGGWYDAEDLYGSIKIYKTIEKENPGAKNSFVMGPWHHGGWARTDGTKLGNLFFGDNPPPSKLYLEEIERRFFNHHLKGAPDPGLPEAYAFETGTNRWRRFDTWPPKHTVQKRLYFREQGSLSFDPPDSAEAFDEFISDPAKPVPFTQAITARMTREYMTDDQRFAARRPDVLVYQTGVLEHPITFAGSLTAHLEVSTTGTDADWAVKLIDVYPDDHKGFKHVPEHVKMGGYQQMVRSEAFRGRFRNSYENPEPFAPGEVETVRFELLDVLHTFKKGHRVMIQVHSTWFPLVDRNPQKYVDNIYTADKEDFIKATHRVHRSKTSGSHVTFGVIDASSD